MSQEETNSLGRSYLEAFTGYSDKEITDAAAIYREEGEYYPPRPRQILDLVKDRGKGKHDDELRRMWTCNACRQKVGAISEGICLDCRGVPVPQYDKSLSLGAYEMNAYRIEGRIKCNQCGHIAQCIKEPADSEHWLCVECYGGLNRKQIAARFHKLAEIMGTHEAKRKSTGKSIAELDAEIRHPTAAQIMARQQGLLRQAEYLKEHGVPDRIYDENGDRIPY